MKYTRVRDVIKAYKDGKIPGLAAYFSQDDLIIEKNSWSERIYKLLCNNQPHSVVTEIEFLITKFNFYGNVPKKEKT